MYKYYQRTLSRLLLVSFLFEICLYQAPGAYANPSQVLNQVQSTAQIKRHVQPVLPQSRHIVKLPIQPIWLGLAASSRPVSSGYRSLTLQALRGRGDISGNGEEEVGKCKPSLSDSNSLVDELKALASDPQIAQQPQLATRTSDLGLARIDQPAESKGPTPLELAQIEAKKLKEQIDQLYPKLSEATDEADAQQLVEELITPLERLVELEGFWSEDSLGKARAQDDLVKLRDSVKSRKLALGQARDQQLIRLLKRSYSSSLKQLVSANTSSQRVQLIEVLEKLAALSFDQGTITKDLSHYTDAAILYQHVLIIYEQNKDITDSPQAKTLADTAHQELAQIEISMLRQATEAGAITPSKPLPARIAEDKKALEKIRRTARAEADRLAEFRDKQGTDEEVRGAAAVYIEGSKKLFSDIVGDIKSLLGDFYKEAEDELKAAGIECPCKYAIMGLGSMALQQTTPYSDLEFAILMEDAQDEEAARTYLRNLTHLVHFRVINLGETVIPKDQYDVSLDHLGRKGLNFDLGGKTPLGRKDKPHLNQPYELIQTVQGMLHYLRNEGDKMEHMDKLLPFILESTCHVHGDSTLHDKYISEQRKFFQSQDPAGKHAHQARMMKKLLEGVSELDYSQPDVVKAGRRQEGDLAGHTPKLHPDDAGRLYNVKQEIYRLPDRLIYGLAMYFGICSKSGWDAVEQLKQQGIIGQGAAAQQAGHHLKYALSFATMLRLATYLHQGQQSETLAGSASKAEAGPTTSELFRLPEEALQENGSLFRYYYTALPLHQRMEEFLQRCIYALRCGRI